jgi:hypothetical protein
MSGSPKHHSDSDQPPIGRTCGGCDETTQPSA